MRPLEASLLSGRDLYREVILEKLAHARESVLIATANVKDMQVEKNGRFTSVRGGLSLKICPRINHRSNSQTRGPGIADPCPRTLLRERLSARLSEPTPLY